MQQIKGIAFPEEVSFRQLIITGPPGSGKSYLVEKLGGWPGEGYLDLARPWWHDRVLSFRPREVHLGIPFEGFEQSHAVFDTAYLDAPTSVQKDRICLPPIKKRFWQTDWHRKFVFDFQLLSAEKIYAVRQKRTHAGSHPRDRALTFEEVRHQVEAYKQVAWHFSQSGLQVIFREDFEGKPRRFV